MSDDKIFIFGLDQAGKSVIANFLSKGVLDKRTSPSISFTQLAFSDTHFNCFIWDSPGQIKFRKLWVKNAANAKLLIFVLDTSDSLRYQEAKDVMMSFIHDLHNLNAPLLFLFHKLDKPEAAANLSNAKQFFDFSQSFIKEIIPYEVNIANFESLNNLKQKIHDILINVRNAEYQRQLELDEKKLQYEQKDEIQKEKIVHKVQPNNITNPIETKQKTPKKIVLLGLDNAGKTVMHNYLFKKQINEATKPTITNSLLNLSLFGLDTTIWDIPGQLKYRVNWIYSLDHSDLLLYVIDAAALDRFEESKEAFKQIITTINSLNIPLLFCFNKMDLDLSPRNIEDIKKMFNFESLLKIKIHYFETSIKRPETYIPLNEWIRNFLTQ